MNMKIVGAFLLATLLLGCASSERVRGEKPASKVEPQQATAAWSASFELRDRVRGKETDEFKSLQQIEFLYRVANDMGESLRCSQSEGGPRIHFRITQDGAPIADNLEGLMFTQAIVEFEIPLGTKVFAGEPAGWESFLEGTKLPAGSYTAHASPRFRCDGIVLNDFEIPFRVVK